MGGGRTWLTLFAIQLLRCLLLVSQLRHAVKRILNIMKVCTERNNLQLELIRYGKQY